MAATEVTFRNILLFVVTISSTAVSAQQSPLFPIGTMSLSQTGDIDQHQITLGNVFPFYGLSYQDIWISVDGIISFNSKARFNDVNLGNSHIPASSDFPFIAPYFLRGESINSGIHGLLYTGDVYYYEVTDGNFLINAGQNISAAVVGTSDFLPNLGVVVTWKDVIDTKEAESGCSKSSDILNCKTNTFQAAIFTDGTDSFAIFNYERMDVEVLEHHQAGFNAGGGRGWFDAIPHSELSKAPDHYGSDVRGRYIYKISGERVIRGGCAKYVNGPVNLEVWPRFAGMFGGEMLEITGHCLESNVNVKCKFEENGVLAGESDGYQVNNMMVRCPVPHLLARGRLDLSMSSNDGSSYRSKGIITIVHPSRMFLNRVDVRTSGDWNETSASSLSLTWSPDRLSISPNDRVSVTLIGYQETTGQPMWSDLHTIGTNIPNNGRVDFDPLDHACTDDACNYELGFMEVKLVDPSQATNYAAIVGQPFPLGWFVNQRMNDLYGDSWVHQKCTAWYNADKDDTDWINQLLYCPCNLNQALVDIGRWQPDMGCNLYTGSKCTFHYEAIHCVRAVQPTATVGAGNQCCYGKDGLLLYAADTNQGSTPDKSHDWGAVPYVQNGHVPSLSHGLKDVITFYYCCLWANPDSGDCNHYMDLRPTRDCNGYQPPKAATIYGQGHVNTFDGGHFRSCGEGDFFLVKHADFVIQGRFQKRGKTLNDMIVNNTVILTSIAVQYKQETVQILLTDTSSSGSQLRVFVDGKVQTFEDLRIRWQDFKNMAVVNNAESASDTSQSNFTIILKNGVGVQVAKAMNVLEASVVLPMAMKGKVMGLLGTWDDNATNDFNGTANGVDKQHMKDTYLYFQYAWRVGQANKIMQYTVNPKAVYTICVASPAFIPNSYELSRTCNGDESCEIDYRSTNSPDAAKRTLFSSQWAQTMTKYLQQVRSCGLLDVPRSTKTSNNYTLDSSVTVTGCKTGTLQGSSYSYTCEAVDNVTQEWYPSVSAVCGEPISEADIGVIVGVVVAVVVLVIVAVVVAVCMVRRRRMEKSRSKERSYDRESPPEEATRYTDMQYKADKHGEEERGRNQGKEFDM